MNLIIIGIFVVWNVVTFFLMGLDKRKAKKNQYRISEKTLFISALCFGALGATIGMNFFRHKTKHWYFEYGFPLLVVIQLAILLYFISKMNIV